MVNIAHDLEDEIGGAVRILVKNTQIGRSLLLGQRLPRSDGSITFLHRSFQGLLPTGSVFISCLNRRVKDGCVRCSALFDDMPFFLR